MAKVRFGPEAMRSPDGSNTHADSSADNDGFLNSKYASLLVDSTFKRAFGENNKDFMIMFLEAIIPDRKIRDIRYSNTVHHSQFRDKHDSVFDLECIDADSGERFDVEVQLEAQEFFYDRALYYSSFMLGMQLDKGATAYRYPPVYVISLLNFRMHRPDDGFLFRYCLQEERTHERMTDKLNFIFMELPNARPLDTPGAGTVEKFCFAMRNMTGFEEQPPELQGIFFGKLFELSKIANFGAEDKLKYIRDMVTERDRINQLAFAEKKGREEGREEGREQGRREANLQAAKNLLALGADVDMIVKATGLDEEEVLAMR